MKLKNIKIFGIIAVLVAASILFISSRSGSDELRKDLLLKVVSFALNSGHYEPAELNDDFSEKVFNLYIDRIDFSKRYFLKEDMNVLSKYEKKLDEAFISTVATTNSTTIMSSARAASYTSQANSRNTAVSTSSSAW